MKRDALEELTTAPKKDYVHPGRVAQLVSASYRYAKVEGPIASQNTYKNQRMSAWIGGTTKPCFYLSQINF